MKPNISEFSYGYALTSELLNHYKLKTSGAPLFPSLIEEGKVGYDLKIATPGVPLFLQFKLSHLMVRGTAAGSHLIATPHYRMYLRALKHSRQHNLLLQLESRGHEVYYAAPMFSEPAELNDAYGKNEVVVRSAFFRPQAIGPMPDQEEHFVIFGSTSATAWRLSEPSRFEREEGRTLFRERLPVEARSDRAVTLGADYFRALASDLVSLWEESVESPRRPEAESLRRMRDEREPGDFLTYVSQTLLDCEVLFAVREEAG